MMAVAAALVLFVVGVPPGATPVVLTGTCVQWSGGYSRASCDQAHAGKIVGTATNPDGCAARSSFFRYDSRVDCVDTSQERHSAGDRRAFAVAEPPAPGAR